MDVFIFLLLGVANLVLLIGFIKPSIVRLHSRVAVLALFCTLSFGLLILLAVVADVPPTEPTNVVVDEAPLVADADAVADVSRTEEEGTPPEERAGKVEDWGAPAVVATEAEKPTPPVDSDVELFDVVGIVDGDTIKVSIGETVETLRLIGIDTPETKDPRKPVQCFGEEASRKTTELLLGKRVRLDADASQGERDRYGRLLRYVWREDGLLFNEWMIRNGYAFEYTYNTPYQYQATFKEAQRYASDNNLGLWSPTTCAGNTSAGVPMVPVPVAGGGGSTYYTSSHPSATYYYCDTDPGWEGLSPKYLRSFPSEGALRSAYPSRTLHEACEGG